MQHMSAFPMRKIPIHVHTNGLVHEHTSTLTPLLWRNVVTRLQPWRSSHDLLQWQLTGLHNQPTHLFLVSQHMWGNQWYANQFKMGVAWRTNPTYIDVSNLGNNQEPTTIMYDLYYHAWLHKYNLNICGQFESLSQTNTIEWKNRIFYRISVSHTERTGKIRWWLRWLKHKRGNKHVCAWESTLWSQIYSPFMSSFPPVCSGPSIAFLRSASMAASSATSTGKRPLLLRTDGFAPLSRRNWAILMLPTALAAWRGVQPSTSFRLTSHSKSFTRCWTNVKLSSSTEWCRALTPDVVFTLLTLISDLCLMSLRRELTQY